MVFSVQHVSREKSVGKDKMKWNPIKKNRDHPNLGFFTYIGKLGFRFSSSQPT